ncbi:MAG: hypothetical protein ACN4GW_00610 [Desulforhopalus sp.]
MNLQQKLDQVKKQFVADAPPEAVSLIQKSTEDLVHSDIMDHVVKPGDRMPTFTLPDTGGKTFNSLELLEKGPLVISFYRGVW